MSGNRFEWSGLAELQADLRTLPVDLTADASPIVDNAAELAKAEIIQRYPRRTGKNLRAKVTSKPLIRGAYAVGVQVVNSSKLAWIFENGSQARHTTLGANRGSMPPGHVFIPAITRHRRTMYGLLKDLLVRHGLAVTGDA